MRWWQTAVNGKANKQQLTKNPFVTEFEYGVAGQGYWDYNHMVLQMEDCIDVLHVLHGVDKYDYQFLYNHLLGHDKQQPDSLSVTRMTKYFRGAQAKMRDTVITMEQQLGTYPRSQELGQLFLGNTQSMQYKPSNHPTEDLITCLRKREFDNAMAAQRVKFSPKTRQKRCCLTTSRDGGSMCQEQWHN
jgi:hypothetical protein